MAAGTRAWARASASPSFTLRVMVSRKCSRASWRTDGSLPWRHRTPRVPILGPGIRMDPLTLRQEEAWCQTQSPHYVLGMPYCVLLWALSSP